MWCQPIRLLIPNLAAIGRMWYCMIVLNHTGCFPRLPHARRESVIKT